MQAQRSDAIEYNPVVWFEIYVEDMKRAKTFYEGLLDVALEEAKMEGVEMWIFPHDISKTGAAGALIKHEMRPPNVHGTLVYFSVPDCGERQDWASAEGMPVYVPKMDIGEHVFIAIVGDSEGNSVGLHYMV